MFLCDLRYRCDIRYRQQRIGRTLHIDRLYFIINGRLYRCLIRSIYDLVCDTEILKYIIQNTEGTAVDIVGHHQFITALK